MTASPTRVHHMLDHAAEQWPSAPSLEHLGGAWTFGEMADWGRRAAGWLLARGVASGQRVVLVADNCPLAAALVFGASRTGAVWCLIHPDTKAARLAAMLADCEPALIVWEPGIAGAAAIESWRAVELATAEREIAGAHPLTSDGDSSQSVAGLVYTSGSSSTPKAVMVTHANICFTAPAIQSRLGIGPADRIGLHLPLSFDYGLYHLFLACLAGARVMLGRPGEVGPAWPRRLVAERVTFLPVVPHVAGLLLAWLEARPGSLPHLRAITTTGEAFPESWLSRFRAVAPNLRVYVMYGLTECKRVAIRLPDEGPAGSVGHPLPGTGAVALDEAGRELPPGAVGQLAVWGPHVTAGYWRAPAATAERFVAAAPGTRLLLTGDEGWLDADGSVFVRGRLDGVYKWRGFRVSAAEVEAAAQAVPGVAEAGLAPPAGDRGPVLLYAGPAAEALVAEALREALEWFRAPERVLRLDGLPRTPTAKVDRAGLRALVDCALGASAGQLLAAEQRRHANPHE